MSGNPLFILGLAKKAGRLEVGEEPVGAAARARQAELILVAGDAADNSRRRAVHFAEAGGAPWVQVPFTKEELGAILGRKSCAMAALTDTGFAAALLAKLSAQDAGRYGELAQQLDRKAQKVIQRQKEQRRHEKKRSQSRRKPWAAPPQAPKKAEAKPAAPAAGRPVPKGKIQVKGKLPHPPKKTT